MNNKKVIFVDCFDTIILRKIPAEKVKYLWAKNLNEIYTEISCNDFYNSFLSAENKARHVNYLNHGIGETNLELISKVIYERFNIYDIFKSNYNENDFIKNSIDSYIKAEESVIYANKKIIKLLENFKKQDYSIFVISDFYCSSEIISELFKFLNIHTIFDKIYVSCDHFMTKANGNLYKHVIETNNLNPKDITMIGDHKHSDIEVPKSIGISTIKVKEKNKQFKLKEKLSHTKLPKEFYQIFKKNKINNFSNVAFSLFVFTKRLFENLKQSNVKNIFFLSREGEFLKKLFDRYVELSGFKNIKSHYLQVSRNSILVAGLKDLESEKFETIVNESITNKTEKISVNDFLKTLSFKDGTISDICKEMKVDPNLKFANFLNTDTFNQLKSNKTFADTYNSIRQLQKNAFSKYLNSFSVDFISEGLNVVDVGWKGTMQDLLLKFFDSKINIKGFYLGYNGLGDENRNNLKYGLLYSSSPFLEDLENRIYKLEYLNYEQFLRASTNRVVGYEEHENTVSLVYDNTINDDEFYKTYIKNFQIETFEKFEKIFKLFRSKQFDNIEKICLNFHVKMLKKISFKDFKFISICNNNHYDSFAKIGFTIKNLDYKKEFLKYVLRKIKLDLKFILNKI